MIAQVVTPFKTELWLELNVHVTLVLLMMESIFASGLAVIQHVKSVADL